MNTTGMLEIVGELIDLTVQEKLNWTETADENTFRSTLESGMFRIRRTPDQRFELVIMDDRNNVLEMTDSAKLENLDEMDSNLKVLWEYAKKRARNTDDKFAALRNELRMLKNG